MRLLFVTYRWGADLIGGAEIHHRRLVEDLVALGHEVTVWTTTGRGLSPVAHWGTEWEEGYPAGESREGDVTVKRFPLRSVPRNLIGLGAKLLERGESRLWGQLTPADLAPLGPVDRPSLLHGWHFPEREGDALARWTHARAWVAFPPGTRSSRLSVSGFAPKATRVEVRSASGRVFGTHPVSGWFSFEQGVELDGGAFPTIALIPARTFSPLKDHRRLGVRITHLASKERPDVEYTPIELGDDVRALGRRAPDAWWPILDRHAGGRGRHAGRLFDWLRGPRCPELERALWNPGHSFDAVVAANLPWSTVPSVVRACRLPVFAMALWHLEDDFYYWRHYLDSLKACRLVLANTEFSAERFFRPRGIRAEFVGPGIPIPPEPTTPFDAAAWRARVGLEPGEAMVLTVCRKSPEKRYDVVADAVGRLRAAGRRVRMVLVGPDNDGRPLADHVVFPGRMSEEELDGAYRAADVMVLMSESESFGMVLAEAWMRGCPVIANAACGPAASLVDEGRDGLLARDAASLADSLAGLIDDPARARAMGAAGRAKSLSSFTQRAATERFLAAADRALSRA